MSPLRTLSGFLFLPLFFALTVAAQQPGSSSSDSGDAARGLNDAVHRERSWSNDPNDPNARSANAPRIRAGSAVGTIGTSVEPNEAVFTVMAGLNACGYDAGLAHANAIRLRVRDQMQQEVAASPAASSAQEALCTYVRKHDLGDPAKTIGQYISLALMMTPTGGLELTTPIPQLPPDATQVAGIVPALKDFAAATHLHAIWVQERAAYDQAMAPLRAPLTNEILQASVYLRETAVGNQDRRFVVIVEPMLANGLVSARVYGLDYLMVLAPPHSDAEARRFQDDVKHFYLDFSIEPLIFGYPGAMNRLQPLLQSVAEAPIGEVYRDDIEALVSECLIRAIEARTMDTGITFAKKTEGQRFAGDAARAEVVKQQQSEAIRVARVQRDVQEGFILTRYFYEQLVRFEHSTDSLRDQIGSMVYGMDVDMQRRQARHLAFIAPTGSGADHAVETATAGLRQRDPSLAKPTGVEADPLAQAQQSLSKGDTAGALALAEEAITKKQGDPGRAMYLVAQAHAMQGEMTEAEQGFAQALTMTKDPHTVAWSHIYLGRIDDIKQERAAALSQYKAALEAKSGLPDAIAAAQNGLAAPYAIPKREPMQN